jgi:hypothetical protein
MIQVIRDTDKEIELVEYHSGWDFHYIFNKDTLKMVVKCDSMAQAMGYRNFSELMGSNFGLDVFLKIKRDIPGFKWFDNENITIE